MALRMALHEPAASQNPGPKEQHIPQGSPPRVRARRVAASLSKVPTLLGANTLPCWLLSPCGVWKSHEEAGIREQVAEREQQQLLMQPCLQSRGLTTPSQGHFHQSKVCTTQLAPSFSPLRSIHSFFPSPDRQPSPGLEQSRNHYRQRLPLSSLSAVSIRAN